MAIMIPDACPSRATVGEKRVFAWLRDLLPDHFTARNIAGLVYLVLISGILAYALWFWGLQRLSASAVTFLTLLNPVTAAVLGWVILDQRFNHWQVLGAVLILISVVLGQPGTFYWRRRRRSALAPRPSLAAPRVRGRLGARPTIHLR